MPRPPSAFLGNYKFNARPVVSHSPDCVVYINGELTLPSCGECLKTVDINKYVQNVSVDLSVDSPPGSASISLVIPSQVGEDWYFDGNLIITTMMEVEIFMKGYFTVDGVPRYYPVFWGLTTNVDDSFSSGEYTVNISCADILHWWQTQHVNINPALAHWNSFPGTQHQMYGHKFSGKNPYDIIYSLSSQVFGDVRQAARSLTGYYAGRGQKNKKGNNNQLVTTMLYWQKRFARMTRALVLYGLDGNIVRGEDIGTRFQVTRDKRSKKLFITDTFGGGNKRIGRSRRGGFVSSLISATQRKNEPRRLFDPTRTSVAAFQQQFQNAGNVEFWESEYLSKLEIAQQCAQSIGFEFYMDPTGEIVFKPPFWNIDVRPNFPVSWIRDIDIIDWGFTESESEICTQLNMKGSFTGKVNYGFGAEIQPVTSLTDYKLLRKYGWRTQDYHCDYWSNPRTLFLHGFNIMDHMNINAHQGSVTIPIRPELRMGFPVYIEPKDCFWYVKGVNHSFSRGGRCTTSLSLTGRRAKFFGPKSLGKKKTKRKPNGSISDISYIVPVTDTGDAGNWDDPPIFLRDTDGKLIGRPNVAMAFDRGWRDLTLAAQARAINVDPKKFNSNKKLRKEIQKKSKEQLGLGIKKGRTFDEWLASQTIGKTGYGLFTGGLYSLVEDPDVTEVIYRSKYTKNGKTVHISEEELDPKTGDVKKTTKKTSKKSKVQHHETRAVFPVSDENGYEVVGNYRYGRGLMIVPSGELKRKPVQTATSAAAQDQANNRGFRDSVRRGYAYGTGLQPGTVSAEIFLKMEPGSTVQASGNAGNTSPGNVKGLPQTIQAESTGGAKAAIPVEATEADPWTVRADASGHARTLYELSPSFSDPLAGPSATDCACTLQRADVFLDLAKSGGIFGFLRDELRQVRGDTVVGDKTSVKLTRHYSDYNRHLIGGGTKRKGVRQIPAHLQKNARSASAAMEVMHDYFAQYSTSDPPNVRITVSGGGGYTAGTGHVKNSPHYKAIAMDLYIKVDGKYLPASTIYGGVGRLIIDGKLPDGGVGWYAHANAFAGKGNPRRSYSIVHYDVGRTRKWVWRGQNTKDLAKKGFSKASFQDMIDNPDRFPPGFDLAGLVAEQPGTDTIPSHAQYLSGAESAEFGSQKVVAGGGDVIGFTLPSTLTKGDIMRRIENNLTRLNTDRDFEHSIYEKDIRGATAIHSLNLDPGAEQALLEFLRFSSPQRPPQPARPPISVTHQVQSLPPQGFLDRMGLSLPNGVDGTALSQVLGDNLSAIFELSQLQERLASGGSDREVRKMLQLQDALHRGIATAYFEAIGENPSDTDLLFVEQALGSILNQATIASLAAEVAERELRETS